MYEAGPTGRLHSLDTLEFLEFQHSENINYNDGKLGLSRLNILYLQRTPVRQPLIKTWAFLQNLDLNQSLFCYKKMGFNHNFVFV